MTLITESSNYIQNTAPNGAFSGSLGGSLGKDANKLSTFDESLANKRSVARLKLLDTARKILARHDIKNTTGSNRHRTRYCHAVPAYNKTINITLNTDESASSAGLSGMQTCGSICSCPVCATNAMLEHGQNIRKALIWAELNNLRPVMMTLTARHNRQMTLKYFMEAFRDAYNTFQRHRKFRSIKQALHIAHQITSREITHGKNGWHYHMHILFFVPASSVKHANNQTDEVNSLTATWLRSLELSGLDATDKTGLDLSAGKENKTYLAKLGYDASPDGDLAYELTGNANKGKSVWDLLTMAHYGDIGAEALYVEYVQQMTGFKWVTYSSGLKDLCEDIELECSEVPDNQVKHEWMTIDQWSWNAVCRLGKVSSVVRAAARWRDKRRLRQLLDQLADEWYYRELVN